MPELPEVETVRRGLAELLPGKTIQQVNYDWPSSFPNEEAAVNRFLRGATITNVRRRAKVILLDLSSKYSLVIHLKMTGQLVYVEAPAQGASVRFGAGHPTGSLVGHLPDKSTRVTLQFSKRAGTLFFNDQRKFGWMKLLPTPEVFSIDFFKAIGPEPLDPSFTAEQFRQRFMRRQNTSIKAALIDQSVVAGIGNIYADESLWGAQIHPATLVRQLTSADLNTLFAELRFILHKAVEAGGSTDKNYVNVRGGVGSYLTFARVFRREGQPCFRCGQPIQKVRVAGRGTHVCSNCQKVTP